MDSLSANRQHQHQTLVLDVFVFCIYTKKSCFIREVIDNLQQVRLILQYFLFISMASANDD